MRQPTNIHVYLFRERGGAVEYAIFQRADNPLWWQGVSGGAEEGETPEEAARRELLEEAGVGGERPLYRLDTTGVIPAAIFRESAAWGADVVVCPMIFYAMPYDGEIVLSDEHTEVRWLPYGEAEKRVYWHDQKNALWELDERLRRGNLVR